MKGTAAVRELQVFCDLPAEAAICEAAAFFTERGLKITRQDPHSLGLLGPTAAAPSTDHQAGSPATPSSGQQPPWRPASWAPLMQRDNLGTARDAGAVAAVTAQVDAGQVPRLADGGRTRRSRGRGGGAGRALAPRAVQPPAAAVTAKERTVFTERGWAEREAAVRANWRQERCSTRAGSSNALQSSGNAGRTSPAKRSRKTSRRARRVEV